MEDTGNTELPFDEYNIGDNIFIRKFYQGVDCGDLHWHRDREDRIIESIGLTDWMIQLDNQLPKSLNDKILIPMGVWHRLLKGNGDLEIKLIKIIN